MQPHNQPLLQQAKTWFNRSMFNTPRAGEYFEYLLEGIDPMKSALGCKARVVRVVEETPDTKTWWLSPGERWTGFKAGQHIQVTVEKNGVRHTRTFTISSSPTQWRAEQVIAITVKKVAGGCVTPWMHDAIKVADIIRISQAAGDFTLPETLTGPVGYLAAGSGITPIMSQLRELAAAGMPQQATLLYFANTRKDFIFGAELRAQAKASKSLTSHLIASQDDTEGKHRIPQSFIGEAHIDELLKSAPKSIYLCGPYPFREIAKILLQQKGYDMTRVYEEAFGLPPVTAVEGEPVTVSFLNSKLEAKSSKPGTLLEMAEGAGLTPNAGCRMGICYTCKCTKKSGQVRDVITGKISSSDEEDIRLCVSTPVSNVEIEL